MSIALAGLMYFISLVKYCSCMLVLLALAACGQNEPAEALTAAPDRPNFVIIMTDDMGFTDFGAFGGRDMKTPNLDNLALNGIRFTNFHGHLSCAPSRAMLMSGMGNNESGLGTQRDI